MSVFALDTQGIIKYFSESLRGRQVNWLGFSGEVCNTNQAEWARENEVDDRLSVICLTGISFLKLVDILMNPTAAANIRRFPRKAPKRTSSHSGFHCLICGVIAGRGIISVLSGQERSKMFEWGQRPVISNLSWNKFWRVNWWTDGPNCCCA